MHAILAIVRKDFLQLRRDPAALFFALGWPLIVAVMFGVLFGGEGGGSAPLKVTLVDLDQSVQSQAFAKTVLGLDTLTVDRGTSLDAARDAVRRGQRTAAIVLPRGWGASGGGGFNPDALPVDVLVDPSRKAEQAMLEGMLTGASMQTLADTSDPAATQAKIAQSKADVQGLPPAQRDAYSTFFDALGALPPPAAAGAGDAGGGFTPLKLRTQSVQANRTGPASAHAVTFPQGMFWAVLGCLMTFATTLATERSEGTWLRLRTAPVDAWQLLAGKGLACGLAMLLALNVLALVGALAFGVRANWWLLELAFACGAFAFTALMMVLAMLGRSVRAASGYAWAVLMPLAMLGGAMIPLFAMPAWMQSVALVSPVRWLIVAIEGASWRGFSASEMVVPCAVLVGVGVVLLGWVRLRAKSALA